MNKQVVEGYLFISSGCEHGPTIMNWVGEWDEKKYKLVSEKSWCSNNFMWSYDGNGGTDYDDENPSAKDVEFDLTPGKKYRITVEEIK